MLCCEEAFSGKTGSGKIASSMLEVTLSKPDPSCRASKQASKQVYTYGEVGGGKAYYCISISERGTAAVRAESK